MRLHRRAILRMLELIERALGPARGALLDERDHADTEAKRLEHGGWKDGVWVRVASIACQHCVREHPAGSVFRVKRFTCEARENGEWVFDRPTTSFCCASGLVLESAPLVAVATALAQEVG